MKKIIKKTTRKGWAVLGQWGITLVTTDLMFKKEMFEKEQKRLARLGYNSGIVSVKITY